MFAPDTSRMKSKQSRSVCPWNFTSGIRWLSAIRAEGTADAFMAYEETPRVTAAARIANRRLRPRMGYLRVVRLPVILASGSRNDPAFFEDCGPPVRLPRATVKRNENAPVGRSDGRAASKSGHQPSSRYVCEVVVVV